MPVLKPFTKKDSLERLFLRHSVTIGTDFQCSYYPEVCNNSMLGACH